jgi:hypothetical protein
LRLIEEIPWTHTHTERLLLLFCVCGREVYLSLLLDWTRSNSTSAIQQRHLKGFGRNSFLSRLIIYTRREFGWLCSFSSYIPRIALGEQSSVYFWGEVSFGF